MDRISTSTFLLICLFSSPLFAEDKAEEKEPRPTIQNRFAEKSGTFSAQLTGVMHIRNDFYDAYGIGADAAYYLNESFGFELRGLWISSTLSSPALDLKERTGLTPDTYPQKGLVSAGVRYSFGYGKLLAFNSFIIHFDPQLFIHGGVAFAERRVIPTTLIGLSLLNHFRWGIQIKVDLATTVQFENRTDRGNVTSVGFMPLIGIGWSSDGLRKPIPAEEVEDPKQEEEKAKSEKRHE